MTFIFRVLTFVPFAAAIVCLVFVLDERDMRADKFLRRQISYSRAQVDSYGISRTYQRVKIDTDEGAYFLYPVSEFKGWDTSLESWVEKINRSSQAVIWLGNTEGDNTIRGIMTEHFQILPDEWVETNAEAGRFLLYFAGGCLLASALIYEYFRRSYKLDWTLACGKY